MLGCRTDVKFSPSSLAFAVVTLIKVYLGGVSEKT